MKPIWQGKELTLILDHINGINTDDRFENLRWICPNCNQQLDTTDYKRGKKKIKVSSNYCVDYGKEISNHATRCIKCEGINRKTVLEDMPVTREELKQLIRTRSFTDIGIIYNVTDNSIKNGVINLIYQEEKRILIYILMKNGF